MTRHGDQTTMAVMDSCQKMIEIQFFFFFWNMFMCQYFDLNSDSSYLAIFDGIFIWTAIIACTYWFLWCPRAVCGVHKHTGAMYGYVIGVSNSRD